MLNLILEVLQLMKISNSYLLLTLKHTFPSSVYIVEPEPSNLRQYIVFDLNEENIKIPYAARASRLYINFMSMLYLFEFAIIVHSLKLISL